MITVFIDPFPVFTVHPFHSQYYQESEIQKVSEKHFQICKHRLQMDLLVNGNTSCVCRMILEVKVNLNSVEY